MPPRGRSVERTRDNDGKKAVTSTSLRRDERAETASPPRRDKHQPRPKSRSIDDTDSHAVLESDSDVALSPKSKPPADEADNVPSDTTDLDEPDEATAEEQSNTETSLDDEAPKKWPFSLTSILGLAAVLLVVPALAAYLLASSKANVFEAEADVVHGVRNAQFGDVDLIMANAKVEAESRALSADVAERYGLDTKDFIDRRSIEVVVPDTGARSTVLRFTVRDQDRGQAQDQVDDLVERYLAGQESQDPDAGLRADLEAAIADLQLRRVDAQEAVAQAESATEDARFANLTAAERTERVSELDRNRVAAGSRYGEIVRDLDTQSRLLAQLEPQGLQVTAALLTEPFVYEDPVSPKPIQSMALGLAVGLLLGGIWLFAALQFRSD